MMRRRSLLKKIDSSLDSRVGFRCREVDKVEKPGELVSSWISRTCIIEVSDQEVLREGIDQENSNENDQEDDQEDDSEDEAELGSRRSALVQTTLVVVDVKNSKNSTQRKLEDVFKSSCLIERSTRRTLDREDEKQCA
jgi:hypothetical protein